MACGLCGLGEKKIDFRKIFFSLSSCEKLSAMWNIFQNISINGQNKNGLKHMGKTLLMFS